MNPFPPPAGSQSFSTKPMQAPPTAGAAPGFSAGGGDRQGDFGPLPPVGTPIGQPGANQAQIANNGQLMIGGQVMQSPLATMQRPAITDPNIDPSVRNSAIGDGFSGVRDGFLYAGGQRMMPQTGSAAEDQATLYQFGVRSPQNAAAYGAAGGNPVPKGPAPAGGFQGGIDALRAGGPSPGMGQSIQDMRFQLGGGMGGGLPPLAQGGGGNRNRIIEALMRQYGQRR